MIHIAKEMGGKYAKSLGLNERCFDLDFLIERYVIAIDKYYKEDIYNVEQLNLIVNAFSYFSNFELSYNSEKIIDKTLKLLEKINGSEELTKSEMLTAYVNVISKEVSTSKDEQFLDNASKVLRKLASTIEPVEQYEKEKTMPLRKYN